MTKKIIYKGLVHCVTTKSGILYIRRSGKCVLCGNSPPYALAKDYERDDAIGMSDKVDAYNDYLKRMMIVFKECFRVLQQGRYIGVNIADVIQTDKHSREKKPIQFHFYTLLKKCGFEYEEVIIWKKPQGMSTQKRFGVLIQNPYPMYYHPNNIYEPILVFKKPGKFELSEKDKEQNKLNYKSFSSFQSDVWEIMPETGVEHPAPFPVALPKVFFQLHSLKGETILDPFLGSGTSMKAARILRREGIGYEINPNYIDLILKRCGFANSNQNTLDKFQLELDKTDEVQVV